MKDGYYLSTYMHIDPLCNLLKIMGRHDFNLSLWEKRGGKITLVHCWELEKIFQVKGYDRSFYSEQHAISFINGLLKEYNLCIEDMIEIWGTPGLINS